MRNSKNSGEERDPETDTLTWCVKACPEAKMGLHEHSWEDQLHTDWNLPLYSGVCCVEGKFSTVLRTVVQLVLGVTGRIV